MLQTEKQLIEKLNKIEELYSHIAELKVLYQVSSTTIDEQQETIDSISDTSQRAHHVVDLYLKDREESYQKMKQELAQAKEEINALRFSNELLLQKVIIGINNCV
jgi:hypothetical protein